MSKKSTTTPLQKMIVNNVRRFRRDKGWEQVDLAAAIEVSRSHISNIEAGNGCYSIKRLEKIAEVFNCHPRDFFNKIGEG